MSRCPPPKAPAPDPRTDAAADEELAALAKALAHPIRLRILRLLIDRTTCVCGELVDELPVAQSTVSEHLRILKAAGLVRGEIDGPRVCYCLEPATLARFHALAAALAPHPVAPTKEPA